jgi:hypothetical protein
VDKISKKILIKVYDDYSMPWWKEEAKESGMVDK